MKYIEDFHKVIDDSFTIETYKKLNWIASSIVNKKGKIFLCGNGGSMSDAMHFGAELSGRFKMERRPFPVVVLGTNQSSLSAIANDYGYEHVFARELNAWSLNLNDMLFCFSTSGNSQNVVNAAKYNPDILTIGFIGNNDCLLDKEIDIVLRAASDYTPYIQQIHQMMYHYICLKIDEYHRGK